MWFQLEFGKKESKLSCLTGKSRLRKSLPWTIALLLSLLLPGIGRSYTLNPQLTRTATIDEIQILSDIENGTEYSYSKVYFTAVGSATQEVWVLPLERNGVDYTGSKFMIALIQQSIATKSKVYLHAVDTWGLGSQSFFSLFEIPRIRRVILYK